MQNNKENTTTNRIIFMTPSIMHYLHHRKGTTRMLILLVVRNGQFKQMTFRLNATCSLSAEAENSVMNGSKNRFS